MTEQTWTFQDRSTWTKGPWDAETIDKMQWTDEATGLPCLAVRNPFGAWCGYVGVAEGHRLFGVGYGDCANAPRCESGWCSHSPESILSVHGGITYSDFCMEENQPHGICHIPEPGQPDHVWWFGFDTAHAGDLMPNFSLGLSLPSINLHLEMEQYRTLDYVRAECTGLAAQLASDATE